MYLIAANIYWHSTVDNFDSEISVVNTDQVILCVCWQNCLEHLSEVEQFYGFLFHQVVQKH